jgi:hypothetical protein
MSTAINTGILRAAREGGFRDLGAFLYDDLTSSALATQTAATPLTAKLHRVTEGSATASFILKSMVSLEAPLLVIVINDGPNSIDVYPAVGETMNGVANAAQAIAAGAAGIFVNTKLNFVQDWRAGTIT